MVHANQPGARALSARPGAALTLVAATLAGCVSLDPTADVERASTLVAERSGADTGWTSPWYETADAWDGRAPLSSQVAVRVALQNNRAIRREVETIAATRADLVQAHLLPNPVINVVVGFPTDGLGGDPLVAALVQQLAWIWRRPAAIDAAEADLRTRILAVSDAALRLVARTRRAHAQVLFAEAAVALQERNIALVDRSAALLRERFSVGEASRLDLNRIDLELRSLQVGLADRQETLARAKRSMLEILGRADASCDWRADGGASDTAYVAIDLDEPHLIVLAATHRLDVAAADAVVEARAAGVKSQEAGRIPDVKAGVGYQQNFSNRRGVFPSAEITPKIFDDNSARIARAESELKQACIEADRVRQAAIAETRMAWVALRAQQRVVESYANAIITLAEDNLALAREAFDAGATDLTVLIEAQQSLNDSTIELNDRTLAAVELRIELERAVGGSLELPAPVISDASDPAVAIAAAAGEPAAGRRKEAAP